MEETKNTIWESSPKVTFALGLVVGVAIMSTAALVFTLNFMLSGRGLGALAATNVPANTVANTVANNAAPSNQPTTPTNPPRAVDPKRDHIAGPVDAKVTLIEYSDFECPYCAKNYDTVAQIKAAYPKDVRIVFRHFPLSFHPEAQKAAEASECAADQGKFWEMYDKIFAANKAGKMGVDVWKQDAKDLGLDTTKFNNCLDKGDKASRVAEDQTEGGNAGVGGTPATFINGQLIEGALPFDSFKQAIEAAGGKG
ncbi:MAG: thioredoxin domain-containing protein [Patescibacteria group bacterium]|jgi:protein-disulfide isomerase